MESPLLLTDHAYKDWCDSEGMGLIDENGLTLVGWLLLVGFSLWIPFGFLKAFVSPLLRSLSSRLKFARLRFWNFVGFWVRRR